MNFIKNSNSFTIMNHRTGRETFKRNKRIIGIFVKFFKIFPIGFRLFFWDIFGIFSHNIFIGLRYVILKTVVKSCGENVKVGKNVTIKNFQNIEIGSNVSIHENCYLDGIGGIVIGTNVSIAHNCSLLSSNHGWSQTDIPIKYNPIITKALIIHDDVWISCGCRILAGVTLMERSIVAAGAVVNSDTISNSIYGGVPAKLIKRI